jgi:hypothetical protein
VFEDVAVLGALGGDAVSVTDSEMVYVPAAEYVNVGFEGSAPDCLPTPPKFHVYVNGAFPFVVVAWHVAARPDFVQVKATEKGPTITVRLCIPDTAAASVTVNVAVKVPAAVYVWAGFATVLVAPSPKVHE